MKEKSGFIEENQRQNFLFKNDFYFLSKCTLTITSVIILRTYYWNRSALSFIASVKSFICKAAEQTRKTLEGNWVVGAEIDFP